MERASAPRWEQGQAGKLQSLRAESLQRLELSSGPHLPPVPPFPESQLSGGLQGRGSPGYKGKQVHCRLMEGLRASEHLRCAGHGALHRLQEFILLHIL